MPSVVVAVVGLADGVVAVGLTAANALTDIIEAIAKAIAIEINFFIKLNLQMF